MSWLSIVIIAYFINAVVAVIDKSLLVRRIPDPLVYAFYVGFLSIFALALPYLSCLPIFFSGSFACGGLSWPGFPNFLIDIGAGLIFLLALFLFYSALKTGEVSRVVPVVGGLTPVFILLLSFLFLGERLNFWQAGAFVFLVTGGIVVSLEKDMGIEVGRIRKKKFFGAWKMSLAAALVLAIFYICAKSIYSHQEFISGFVWSRMGSFLGSVALLLFIKNRRAVFGAARNLELSVGQPAKLRLALLVGSLVVFNKVLAGAAFVLLNYAISLGNVALVNAAQGTQYVFLLGLTFVVAAKKPHILEENMTHLIFWQKLFAVLLIAAGLMILAFKS
jgi:drug/metabolite transporter (DMT)-like permease